MLLLLRWRLLGPDWAGEGAAVAGGGGVGEVARGVGGHQGRGRGRGGARVEEGGGGAQPGVVLRAARQHAPAHRRRGRRLRGLRPAGHHA